MRVMSKKEDEELERKVAISYLTDKMLQPLYEDKLRRARALGFSTVEEYEASKEHEFMQGNLFYGVVIYPLDQSQILEEFEAALEDPEIMPTGMSDPIDFSLGNYMEMVKDRIPVSEGGKGFIGYRSQVSREMVYAEGNPVFPTNNYEVNYGAVKALIIANGWTLSTRGWVHE